MPTKHFRDVIKKGSGFGLGLGNVLGSHPQLAALAMRVIENVAMTDMRIEGMLATLLKVKAHIAVRMLHSIESVAARRAVIYGAAEHALTREDFRLFTATLKYARTAQDLRNAFAHHIWAVSGEVPDALILINPTHIKDANARFIEFNFGKGEHEPKFAAPGPHFVDKARVYTESDLQEAVGIANRTDQHVFRLARLVDDPNGPRADSTRQELLAEPQIAQTFYSQSPQKSP